MRQYHSVLCDDFFCDGRTVPLRHSIVFTGKPTLQGDIGLGQRRYVPLALMGDALVHVASLVLGIDNTMRGLVLVDDIDTGVHYSVMRSIRLFIRALVGPVAEGASA